MEKDGLMVRFINSYRVQAIGWKGGKTKIHLSAENSYEEENRSNSSNGTNFCNKLSGNP